MKTLELINTNYFVNQYANKKFTFKKSDLVYVKTPINKLEKKLKLKFKPKN